VAAIVLGIPFELVYVASIGGPLSGTGCPEGEIRISHGQLEEWANREGISREQAARDVIVFYLCGFAEENRCPPEGQPDARRALEWGQRICPDQPQSVVEEEFRRALLLCSEYRTAIQAVILAFEGPARHLLQEGHPDYLEREEVEAIVNSVRK